MSVLATLKENKPLAIVVGVSLVLTIALIVTLIVLDNQAQKQVDELTQQTTGTRAALDLAIQELDACGKLDEFVENVKDIPGAPELLETSGALYGSSARKWANKWAKKKNKRRPWWQNRIMNTDTRTKVIVRKVNGLEKLIKSISEGGADTSKLDAEIKELEATIAMLKELNAELESGAQTSRLDAEIKKLKATLEAYKKRNKVLERASPNFNESQFPMLREYLEMTSLELHKRTVELQATTVVLEAVFAEAMKLIPEGDRKDYLQTVVSLAKNNNVDFVEFTK